MMEEAPLDSVVFQLTPTRTRCDLVIMVNGKSQKIASGLLNPFLAHLKAAKDQIAKGGYSISLVPDPKNHAPWFTRGTIERFVQFVSTPEVLERVSTIESEILQIEEAITVQNNENLGLSTEEENQTRSSESIEGSKPLLDADAEKAVVLYKPASPPNPSVSHGSAMHEENSKVQLLKVLETRKTVLQKEQGMAFARATAAGFDMDHMTYLISFAESFGALRLKEACLRFMELWKVKHETGQWLEVETLDLMSSRSGFSPFIASGIVLSGDIRKQNEFGETWAPPNGDLSPDSNGNDLSDLNRDNKLPSDAQVPQGPPEYFQGQFQQSAYPSWPIRPPPGPPVFLPYPVQGMPYYQNYPASGPFYHSPYSPVEDPRFGTPQRMEMGRDSMNSKDSNIGSQDDDPDQNLSEFEKGGSHGHKSHKRVSRSRKKKSGMVVIRNINYITSKVHESSGGESLSVSDSDTGEETEGSQSDTVERKYKKFSRPSKKNERQKKSLEKSNPCDKDEVVYGQDADSGNWQAFQSFLLKSEEKMSSTVDGEIFAGEKVGAPRKRHNISETEPILAPNRDSSDIQEVRIMEFDSVDGKVSRTRQATPSDEFLASSEGRGVRDSHLEVKFKEIEGGDGGFKRAASDDFMIYGRENQTDNNITLDPLGDHEYEPPSNSEKCSYVATDESFIVPVRSSSQDQYQTDSRTPIDMDLEFPSSHARKEDSSDKAKVVLSYEPDDLTLMPERSFESEYISYDPALYYDMQIPVKISVIPVKISVKEDESGDQEDILARNKEEMKESDEEKKLKVLQDGPDKRKKDAMTRRGLSSKTSPLTEAQKRAEKLRAYKVDLQKAKKENEEEQRKRLEALKLERQKRIAARTNSNASQSPSSTRTRTGMPTKVSPSSFKASKLGDSEPSSHSPIQKLTVKSTSSGSNDSQRTTKPNRPSGSTNGLNRSVSSLPEVKKENNSVIPEAVTISERLRRLSEPKLSNNQRASNNSESTDHVPKRNITNEPQVENISAIIPLDKTQSAALPELKIGMPRDPSYTVQHESTTEALQKGPGSKSSPTSPSVLAKKTDEKPPRVIGSDANPIIEKTVLMLENERINAPLLQVSEGMAIVDAGSAGDNGKGMGGLDSEYAAVRSTFICGYE